MVLGIHWDTWRASSVQRTGALHFQHVKDSECHSDFALGSI